MTDTPNTILVVEDDTASRKLIRTVLRDRGYTIQEAEDLEAAREALSRGTPDLVLLDMRLKGRDGLELVRKLRSDPRYEKLPIAAVTAHAMYQDRNRFLQAGCDAYISKPIDTRQLPPLVDDLIERGRRRGHAA